MNIISPAIEAIKYKHHPFPLRSLIQMYHRSRKESTYCNYFDGFKKLRAFLDPIDSYGIPEINPGNALLTYEMNQLCSILKVPVGKIYYLLLECEYGYEIATTISQQQRKT